MTNPLDFSHRPTILVVDDTPDNLSLMSGLLKDSYKVKVANSGEKALKNVQGDSKPDLILLDIMMPGLSGYDVIRELKSNPATRDIPVIFLTARASETDRIVGLELGANDYIVKPFFIREVIARIRLQFRSQPAPTKVLRAGALELDRSACQAKLAGRQLTLTATEFRLLEYLMTNPGIVFSREQLLNSVWGQDRAITDRTVDVYVLRLRQKIEGEPNDPAYIHAVRGFGYSFRLPEPVSAVA